MRELVAPFSHSRSRCISLSSYFGREKEGKGTGSATFKILATGWPLEYSSRPRSDGLCQVCSMAVLDSLSLSLFTAATRAAECLHWPEVPETQLHREEDTFRELSNSISMKYGSFLLTFICGTHLPLIVTLPALLLSSMLNTCLARARASPLDTVAFLWMSENTSEKPPLMM